MRKQLKNTLNGIAELSLVFTLVFVMPAVISALVNFSIDVYFSCVQHPGYCALMTIISIIFCIFYMSMYDQEKTKL